MKQIFSLLVFFLNLNFSYASLKWETVGVMNESVSNSGYETGYFVDDLLIASGWGSSSQNSKMAGIIAQLNSNEVKILEEFQLNKGLPTYNWGALQIKGAGTYISGFGANESGNFQSFIRFSENGKDNWQTLDVIPLQPNESSRPYAMVANKNWIFSLFSISRQGTTSFLIRRSGDLGKNWETVADFSKIDGRPVQLFKMILSDSGVLFASGKATSSENLPLQIVILSEDNGKTWKTLDYQEDGTTKFRSYGLLAIGDSNLISVGDGNDFGGENLGLHIRRSKNMGASWEKLPLFVPSNASAFQVTGAKHFGGVLLVTATAIIDGIPKWIFLSSKNLGESWTIEDVYSGAGGLYGRAIDAIESPEGEIFVFGQANEKEKRILPAIRKSY